jgi:hypothetical protein
MSDEIRADYEYIHRQRSLWMSGDGRPPPMDGPGPRPTDVVPNVADIDERVNGMKLSKQTAPPASDVASDSTVRDLQLQSQALEAQRQRDIDSMTHHGPGGPQPPAPPRWDAPVPNLPFLMPRDHAAELDALRRYVDRLPIRESERKDFGERLRVFMSEYAQFTQLSTELSRDALSVANGIRSSLAGIIAVYNDVNSRYYRAIIDTGGTRP